MGLLKQVERFEQARPVSPTAAWIDQPLPPLLVSELTALNAREGALPARSSAQARTLILTAVAGGGTLWGLLIAGVTLALKLIA
jgi:hypothetical protein